MAIYALADHADPNHQTAFDKFDLLLQSGEEILVHNYVPVESAALIQARLGLRAALLFLKDARGFEIDWVEATAQQEAFSSYERSISVESVWWIVRALS